MGVGKAAKDKASANVLTMDPFDYPSSPSLRRLTSPSFGPPREAPNPALKSLGTPHVESFNFMLEEGLTMAVNDIPPLEFVIPQPDGEGVRVSLSVTKATIEAPKVPFNPTSRKFDERIFPSETRQRGVSYKGNLTISFEYSIDGMRFEGKPHSLGKVPIMLLSKACNLHGLAPKEMVHRGEQETEWGGYFVIGGHERLIRMLQTTRRNYPIAMQRPSWKNRGKNFSDLGVLLECGKPDLTTVKNVLHFVNTGTAKLMFSYSKELFFVPVVMVLKCLSNRSDAAIYAELIGGTSEEDHYYRGCIKNMLSEPQQEGLFTPEQIRSYIGRSFRDKVVYDIPTWYSDEDVCDFLMKRAVCIHLNENEDKFQILVLMIKKLFALVQDQCVVEGVDSVMMHEIVLGGHLYLQLLKEKLGAWLYSLRSAILKRATTQGSSFKLNPSTMDWCVTKSMGVEKIFEKFIATGNMPSSTGLGLMQDKGLTIMAENINRMRYMSHFRAIHRGSFFQEMRTTEVRALLPDAWGFVCPVHTPDGSPCGLLSHLAMPVQIVTHVQDDSAIPQVLVDLGMYPLNEVPSHVLESSYHVVMNGKVLGYVSRRDAARVSDKLRMLKIKADDDRVPAVTEIVLIAARPKHPGQYPGLYIFTNPARMMRPVINLAVNQIELIGTLEQVFLDICITKDEAYSGVTTHQELRPNSFLSNLACTIPLPDFNQSPRNMYQCQMGKQTMATPTHTWHLNSETKMYRLQTPTSPFFRPAHYDYIDMDDYPMGTNAVVAVISYTGYDMEDAMIINKSSYDRGFAAGTIYKSVFVDLKEMSMGKRYGKNADSCDLNFERDPANAELVAFLDADGLPFPGTKLKDGDPYYCYYNSAEGKYVVKKFEGKELYYVDSVKACGNDAGTCQLNRVCISFRIQRNPSVGDKFASRAGQKGICSQKWPVEDLPWTESGLVPDIVFNPHGFPSRMTIAMMIECMAGKSGAVHGLVHDATPFRFGEKDLDAESEGRETGVDAIEFFSSQLEKAGYNYYGTETLYSGTDGVAMTADIFFGIIHYQRLRHMVSDKYQVRSIGVIDQVTRQPIKGRRRGGGVRFGEMERDSLLSHGVSFLLQDRLFHGSDKARVKVCTHCCSLLSPRVVIPTESKATLSRFKEVRTKCIVCDRFDTVKDVYLPYIYMHLVCQLASINVTVRLKTRHV